MSKTAKKTSADIYADVTARIIEAIEQGAAPWSRPWETHGPSAMPRNAHGRLYSGVNVVLLWAQAQRMGYCDPRWMTFKQAKTKGGHVRKGERACSIVLWRQVTRVVEGADGEADDVQSFPVIRTFSVFNAAQVEGLGSLPEPPLEDATKAGELIRGSGADIRHGGGRAFYDRAGDFIRLPDRIDFHGTDSYQATCLHELVHWTGAEHRLGRDLSGRFGEEAYAMEELIAELGAAFLCAQLGVMGRHHEHASYLDGWLKVLRRDTRAIVTAASAARRAAEYLSAGA